MCGVLGVVDLQGRPVGETSQLTQSLAGLGHRGPDGRGDLTFGRVWLGHTRLAILDLSPRGAQPMVSASGDLAVSYNGEIFNYRAVRQFLSNAGHRFNTNSDTEVLLAAYAEWGIKCLDRLEGMFAFALHDRRADELYLARDRMGVKPLHFGTADGRMAFCSEPRGILSLPGFRKRIDPRALSSFLSFRQPLGGAGLYDGVRALPAGHYLRVGDRGVEIVRWWSPTGRNDGVKSSDLRGVLGPVIRESSVSDVPVAVLLSGGLDSAVITAELSNMSPDMLAITASIPGADYDEVEWARATARHFNVQHITVPVTSGNYLATARDLIQIKGQPLGMHNEVALFLMAREVKGHASVVMSGEGADELFAGYGRIYRSPFDFNRARFASHLPPWLRNRWLSRIGLSEGDLGLEFAEFFLSKYSYWPISEKLALFTKPMADAVDQDRGLRQQFEMSLGGPGSTNFDRLTNFFLTTHLQGLLDVMDSSFMAAGVEVRVPFADRRIVEMVLALPPDERLRWGGPSARARALFEPVAEFSEARDTTKYALRKAYKDVLPPEVISRRKLPFPVPLTRWLFGEQRSAVEELLFGYDSQLHQIFDRDKLKNWFDGHGAVGHDATGRRLWILVTTELWLREAFPDGLAW